MGISGNSCAGKSTFAPGSPPSNFPKRKKPKLEDIVEGDEDEEKKQLEESAEGDGDAGADVEP